MTASSSLTMSCVKVEMSTVELSGCLLTRRPSLGCRIKLNVMMRFEVLLMSLVTVCKSSFVIGVEEPGGKMWNWIKKITDEVARIIDHETISVKKMCFSCLVFSLAVTTLLRLWCGCIKSCKFSPLEAFHIFWLQIMQNKLWNRLMRVLWCVKLKLHCRHHRLFTALSNCSAGCYIKSKHEIKNGSAPCRRRNLSLGENIKRNISCAWWLLRASFLLKMNYIDFHSSGATVTIEKIVKKAADKWWKAMIEGKRGQSTVKFIHHLSWALPPSLSVSHGKFPSWRKRERQAFLSFYNENLSCSESVRGGFCYIVRYLCSISCR